MRIMCNFLSAKKKVNSDLIRTHFLMIIFDIIYHVYQHMWVVSANKKYSELERLWKEKHSLSWSKDTVVSTVIKKRSPVGSDKLCLA